MVAGNPVLVAAVAGIPAPADAAQVFAEVADPGCNCGEKCRLAVEYSDYT